MATNHFHVSAESTWSAVVGDIGVTNIKSSIFNPCGQYNNIIISSQFFVVFDGLIAVKTHPGIYISI